MTALALSVSLLVGVEMRDWRDNILKLESRDSLSLK